MNALCTKIFVEECTQTILTINAKVVTQTVELNRVNKFQLLTTTSIGTLRVEQSSHVNCVYASRDLFTGYLLWAGCFLLRIQVGSDDLLRCDFNIIAKMDATAHIERTQFKVSYVADKMVCEKVIRLKNGFPTTRREDAAYEKKRAADVDLIAKRMGISIKRDKKKIGARIKPNAKCPCGSGMKYKKCCGVCS